MLKSDTNLLELFQELVVELNRLGIEPIIYGGLGLSLLTKKSFEIRDIDFLLKDSDIDKHWGGIKQLLKRHKYRLDPKHKREFIGKKPYISFLSLGDVKDLATIQFSELEKYEIGSGSYRNLNLEQYLDIYQNGLKKSIWRQKRKNESDLKKIALIKKCLKK